MLLIAYLCVHVVLGGEGLVLVVGGEGVWSQWQVVWLLASLDSLEWERVVVLNTEGMGLWQWPKAG